MKSAAPRQEAHAGRRISPERTPHQDSEPGPRGTSLTPPPYGIDFIDGAIDRAKSEGGPLQLAAAVGTGAAASAPPPENRTGLPDGLRAGIEHLSGLPMDDVRVRYDSPKPAQLQALAYAQGPEIHLGPRQERHLPHEAWHVVQQKQGRVRPTMQMCGFGINDDSVLEREADAMGARALRGSPSAPRGIEAPARPQAVKPWAAVQAVSARFGDSVVQMRALNQIIADNINDQVHPDLSSEHTVGLEVEFGYHQNPLLNFTHIELARSEPQAWINDLPFKLETDSGSTVEIVTPPLWMAPSEESTTKDELEDFAKRSVQPAVNIADWVRQANATYPMRLAPTTPEEIRSEVNVFNLDEGVDIAAALAGAQSSTLVWDIGGTVLSTSRKDPTGAHTQTNKAVSIAEYGAERSDLYERIRNDFSQLTEDPQLLEDYLKTNDLWDHVLAGPSADVNAIISLLLLAKRKNASQPPDAGSASYLWQGQMQSVAGIFQGLARPIPEDNPLGATPLNNVGPVSTLIGEKSVTGALGLIGENLQLPLQFAAWSDKDSKGLTIQTGDSLEQKKKKVLAGWHTHVKDITGSWFKGDLRQVLLNERVNFPIAKNRGALEAVVMEQWRERLPVQMVPYHQTLSALGVQVDDGGEITAISEAWLKLPLPDPKTYIEQWENTLSSICRLIDSVTAQRDDPGTDTSFTPPGFLQNFNNHLYNPREDTVIKSQYLVRFPQGGEHRYVVEKR